MIIESNASGMPNRIDPGRVVCACGAQHPPIRRKFDISNTILMREAVQLFSGRQVVDPSHLVMACGAQHPAIRRKLDISNQTLMLEGVQLLSGRQVVDPGRYCLGLRWPASCHPTKTRHPKQPSHARSCKVVVRSSGRRPGDVPSMLAVPNIFPSDENSTSRTCPPHARSCASVGLFRSSGQSRPGPSCSSLAMASIFPSDEN